MNGPSLLSALTKEIENGAAQITGVSQFLQDSPQSSYEILYCAVHHKNKQIIEFLLQQTPPLQIPITTASAPHPQTPLIILAALTGSIEIFQLVCSKYTPLDQFGFIAHNKRTHQAIHSNCLAASAYHGYEEIAKFVTSLDESIVKSQLEGVATESCSLEQIEYGSFTPLMIAIAENHTSIAKLLINSKAPLMSVDSKGNNIIHICILFSTEEMLEYLISKYPQGLLLKNSNVFNSLGRNTIGCSN